MLGEDWMVQISFVTIEITQDYVRCNSIDIAPEKDVYTYETPGYTLYIAKDTPDVSPRQRWSISTKNNEGCWLIRPGTCILTGYGTFICSGYQVVVKT